VEAGDASAHERLRQATQLRRTLKRVDVVLDRDPTG
jgi:hypothetical protein